MARSDGEACVQVFFMRSGKLIGREYFILEGTKDEKNEEILKDFVLQFYDEAAFIPSQVLLPTDIEEARIIKEWLNTKRSGEKVEIKVPKSGDGKKLVSLASENAVETLRALETRWKADKDRQHQALAEIQTALNLPEPPIASSVTISLTPWVRLVWASWWSSNKECPIRKLTAALISAAWMVQMILLRWKKYYNGVLPVIIARRRKRSAWV
jgi:excinuclease UvrABC nuclease subunit